MRWVYCLIRVFDLCKDSVRLLIDMPSAAGYRLVESTCRVAFRGKKSQRCEIVIGFRRNHDYGIKTHTPGNTLLNTTFILILKLLFCFYY